MNLVQIQKQGYKFLANRIAVKNALSKAELAATNRWMKLQVVLYENEWKIEYDKGNEINPKYVAIDLPVVDTNYSHNIESAIATIRYEIDSILTLAMKLPDCRLMLNLPEEQLSIYGCEESMPGVYLVSLANCFLTEVSQLGLIEILKNYNLAV